MARAWFSRGRPRYDGPREFVISTSIGRLRVAECNLCGALVVQDDGGVADATRRIAQEMVTREGVEILTGFGLTPLAMAAAPISARAGVAQIVMVAATSSVTEKSPYIVRTSYTTPQVTSKIAAWVAEDGVKTAMTLVMDYGPGLDAEARFSVTRVSQ